MRRAASLGLCALLALELVLPRAAPAAPADPLRTFLHVFPVKLDHRLGPDEVELAVRSESPDFGEATRRSGALVHHGKLRLVLGGYPASPDPVEPAHRACSFLIDCDEPVVRALAQPPADPERRLALPQLEARVRHHIRTKRHRSFDVASVVARRREGDCTEHAVLLTALARLHGRAARVVLGLVLVRLGERRARAFGHAWAEHHDGAGWRPADAALPLDELQRLAGAERVRVSYLPLQVLTREDPGFTAALVEAPNVLHVTGLAVSGRPARYVPRARSKVRR